MEATAAAHELPGRAAAREEVEGEMAARIDAERGGRRGGDGGQAAAAAIGPAPRMVVAGNRIREGAIMVERKFVVGDDAAPSPARRCGAGEPDR